MKRWLTLVVLTSCLVGPQRTSAAGIVYRAPVVNRFGQVGLFYTHSAMTLGKGRLSAGLHANYSGDRAFLQSVQSMAGDSLRDPGDTSSLYQPGLALGALFPSLGYGITHFIDLSATMPVYFDAVLDSPHRYGFGGLKAPFGDLEIALKVQYPPYPHNRFFEMAYFGAFSIPTGSKNSGYFPRHTYYVPKDSAATTYMATSGAVEFDMKMLWSVNLGQLTDASPVSIHCNYGVRWTRKELDHLFLLNLAFEYQPVAWMNLFTEFSGETQIRNIDRGFKIGDDPLRLSPGVSFTPNGGFYLTLGGDINLSSDTLVEYQLDGSYIGAGGSDYAVATRIEPQWRVNATIGWAGFILPQDADQDGIKDNEDRCPQDPEDLDGFEDSDGCPDTDNDNDGIPDLKDKCPNDPEDTDNFEDEDGCPDNDNDKDLIADVEDQCPMVPEDLDGFEDGDGCPESDNDEDGIADTLDHCITIPEDRDGFQDNDGCPDPDNDLDNIPDSLDKCPDVPGDADNNGCPKAKPKAKEIKRGRVILRGVNFEFGKAVLTGDSYAILDRVYQSLVEWPEIKVEIRGHTDSIGSSWANRRLSQRRAEAVRDYLIQRGITSNRLVAKGMGENEPIADNATAEGRALNRRVELHRID